MRASGGRRTDAAPTGVAKSGSPAPPAGWPLLFTFCAIWCGLVVTELITDSVLPLTLGRHLENAAIIGLVLAAKPFFGFVAQPIIGVWTDRFWTPLGRRALFLLVSAPVVALCLGFVPVLRTAWAVVGTVVVYQFFQDIAWGSDHPLMADLIPAWQRTLLMGMILTSSQLVSYAFYRVGMAKLLPEFGETLLYQIAAAAQVLLVAGGALCLREKPPQPLPRPKLTFRRYASDFLADPILRRFAVVAFLQGACKFSVVSFAVLFATKSAGLPKAAYGTAWAWYPAAALIAALPFGWIAERLLPKYAALACGYALVALACLGGFTTTSLAGLCLVAAALGTGHTLVEVTQKPFFTEYLPVDIIGQLSGAYNVCYALGRTIAIAGTGALVASMGGNYRVIWVIGGALAVAAAATAIRVPDRRHAARRRSP